PTGLVNRDVRTGNRKSETLANQTDLHGSFNLGGVENDFVVGLEYSREELHTGAVPPSADFAVGRTDLFNPTPGDAYGGPRLSNLGSDYDNLTNRTTTRAIYVFNTAHFSPQWEAVVGLRYDDYRITDGTVR